MQLPKTFSDIQAILIDMDNRIKDLERIEEERSKVWKEKSKLMWDLSLKP